MNANLTPSGLAVYFNHTQLRAYAVHDGFVKLCEESIEYGFKMVAINPAQVIRCKELLKDSPVHVSAAIGFPLGQTTIVDKINETKTAVENNSGEIDYMISITELKERNYNYIEKEMARIVDICCENHVISKMVFGNYYLTEAEKEESCRVTLNVKLDFIKTSTGFGAGGATLENTALMKQMVGDRIVIRAAGGVRSLNIALKPIGLGTSRIDSAASMTILEEYKSRL